MTRPHARPLADPARAEPAVAETPRLTPPPGWQHTRPGQLAARLAPAPARQAGQRQPPSGTVGPIGRAYLAAAVARLGDPRQPAGDPEPEAGA